MKTKRGQAVVLFFMGCVFAFLLAGCVTTNKGPSSKEEQTAVAGSQQERRAKVTVDSQDTKAQKVQMQDGYFHTVRWHGETLAYIAKWYTGDLHNWKVLAKANPKLNPNRIYKGNKIVIPEGMLKTRKPLPKNFLAVLSPKRQVKKTSSKVSPQPKEEDALPLFGPKGH